mmetsp:Transcript_38610/g.83640  ORF Transcript_38610/g.83640 Transcript_38610/m.83640 type:complete len:87 (-) Transcript_38610:26-286(-)
METPTLTLERQSGSVYVIPPQQPKADVTADKAASHKTNGTERLGRLGHSMVVADVNGDGSADIVVGAPLTTKHVEMQGCVQVFSGM